MNPNVNYGLCVIILGNVMIITCQCRLINYEKSMTLLEDADNGVGCAHVEAGSLYKISVYSSQFCHEPNSLLKKPHHVTFTAWALKSDRTSISYSISFGVMVL